MAIASILHRISGIILFLAIPLLLCVLQASLSSAEQFQRIQGFFSGIGAKLILFGVVAALLFHLLAGIRHMIMDMGFSEHVHSARRGAWIVMGLSVVLIIFAGIWLW